MAVDELVQAPARVRTQPLRFDLVSPSFKADPFPTLADMQAAGPVIRYRFPLLGPIWLTTTHDACEAMVKDNHRFVQEGRNAGKGGVSGLPWWLPNLVKPLIGNMLMRDEPDHRRLRKLVDAAFQRRDILAMRGRIEAMADRLLDALEGQPRAELISHYAHRLPIDVISELLGLPESDRAEFAAWTGNALAFTGLFSIGRMLRSMRRLQRYVRAQIEEKRRTPGPGLIGDLVRAELDGDRLDENELLAMIVLLLVGGFETTSHLIGGSIAMLETHPDQKAWLMADPAGRIERAVEELARFCSPVQITKPRFVASDGPFFGKVLRKGDRIMAFLAGANADPAIFERPDHLRLDRFPNPHLVFSSGVHFCLGMQLARVETQSAITRLYARYPRLALAQPTLDWAARMGIRGLSTLNVELGPPAR